MSEIQEIFGNRKLAIARELTKTYEEIIRGSAEEVLTRYTSKKPRGEMTVVIAGRPKPKKHPKRNIAAILPPSESISDD